MNKPYKKVVNQLNEVVNPITKESPLLTLFPNRKQRRQSFQKNPFKGNKKGISLSVSGFLKYVRSVQEIYQKDGSIKRINHQILS